MSVPAQSRSPLPGLQPRRAGPSGPPISPKVAFASVLRGASIGPKRTAESPVVLGPSRLESPLRSETRLRADTEGRTSDDPLSAESRLTQRLAPPPEFAVKPELRGGPAPKLEAPTPAARTLDAMLPVLVERIAWHAEGNRGAARLELGGRFAGTSVFVETHGARVRVQMEVPPGVDAERWRERLEARLERAGLEVTSVDVRNL